jgi:threonine dehydratase
MYESVRAGQILDLESKPTLSDATAGGIEKNSITLDICRYLVDDFSLITEDEIKDSIKLILEKHFFLIEGGAALTVAAFLKEKDKHEGKNVVLIISGSKISLEKLREIVCERN